MPEKKKTRKKRVLLNKKTSFLLAALSILMISICISDVQTMVDLQQSIEENEAVRDDVLAERNQLASEKEKLTNADYIEYLARGKYLVTKYGEQVFKFPSVEDIH